MSINFIWNNVEFCADAEVDGDPTGDGSFWLDRLWVVSGANKVEVTDLLQDEHLANTLTDIAFDHWHAEHSDNFCEPDREDTLQ